MIRSISVASVDGIMLPMCYDTDITGKYEYAHDFLTRPDILEQYTPMLMQLPLDSGNENLRGLYFPILATIDQASNSYIPLTSYAYNYLGVIPYEDTNYALNYVIQIHNWLMQSGVQLPVLDYNHMYSGYVNAYNASINQQPTAQQEEAVQQQEVISEPTPESVQEVVFEPTHEPVAETVTQEVVQEPVVEEVQETQQEVIQEPVVEQPTPEPIVEEAIQEPVAEQPTPEPVQEEQQQVVEQPATEVKAFGDTSAQTPQPTVNSVANDDIYVAKQSIDDSQYSLEYNINKSSNAIKLNDVTPEEITLKYQQLADVKVLTDTLDIPVFIPRLYKYELPVGMIINGRESQLAGISLEEFKESLIDYVDIYKSGNLNRNRKALHFGEEVVALISGSKAITLTNILDIFSESASDFNYEFLYELTKYIIVDASPNGLYDNLYKLVYLIQEELKINTKLSNITEEDKLYKTMYILAKLGCNTRKLNITEETLDEDAEDDRETGFTFDSDERMIADATREFSTLLSDIISYDNIITKFSNPTGLPAHKKVCVLGAYGESFNVDNKYLAMYGFDNLEICVKDLYLLVTYLGMKIEPTTLGLMVTVLSRIIKANENPEYISLGVTEEQKQNEVATVIDEFNYNDTLSLISSNPKAPSFVKQYSPITYIRNLNLEGARVIVGRFEKHKGILGFLALDKNHGRPRVYYLPPVSSIYKSLLDNGITIKGILESYDDIQEVFVMTGETTRHCYELKNISLLSNKAQILVRNLALEEIEKGLDLSTMLSTLAKCLSFNVTALKAKDPNVREVEYVDPNRAIAPDWVKEDLEAVNKGMSYVLNKIIK